MRGKDDGGGAERVLAELASVVRDTLYSSLPAGELRYVSPAIEALTGHAPAAFLDDPGLRARLCLPEDLPVAEQLVQDVVRTGRPSEAVYRIRHAGSGRIRHVLDRATPVLEGGAVVRIDGILLDITDRIELEMRLELSEQLRSLGQLARDVAHDFNNLLVSILGHADLLASHADPDSWERKTLGHITSAAEKGSRLTERLLAFARGSAVSGEKSPVSLPEVVTGVAEVARPRIPAKLRLEVTTTGGVPRVPGHPARLGEAVLSLLENAGDACSGESGTKIGVLVREATAAEAARIGRKAAAAIEVSDDGPGMTEDVRSRVFEPLFTTRSREGGTGLGCSIAFGVALDHEGLLEVESEPGKGALFRFLLPAVEVDGGGEAGAPSPRPRTGRRSRADSSTLVVERTPDPDTPSILVVDDEPSVRQLLKDLLDGAGFHVRALATGTEAVAEVRENPERYDLVLLDVMMHPMDGTETWSRLREIAPRIPIVFCTGHSDMQRIAVPGALEEVTIVRKPFRAAHLIRAVRAALEVP